MLRPLLFSLFTHDCKPTHDSNTIVKFADDTIVIGRITNNEEAYRREEGNLVKWSHNDCLDLDAKKKKEMILDFRRQNSGGHNPISNRRGGGPDL